jgi:hypothetical protein
MGPLQHPLFNVGFSSHDSIREMQNTRDFFVSAKGANESAAICMEQGTSAISRIVLPFAFVVGPIFVHHFAKSDSEIVLKRSFVDASIRKLVLYS